MITITQTNTDTDTGEKFIQGPIANYSDDSPDGTFAELTQEANKLGLDVSRTDTDVDKEKWGKAVAVLTGIHPEGYVVELAAYVL